jgi:hypothetical protein
MDNPESLRELEQETIILCDLLEREKLKKAEEIFAHRLVFTAIIFVIILMILAINFEYASGVVQLVLFILFFGAALVALGFICNSYNREQDDARKAINNLKDALRTGHDYYFISRTFGGA